VFGRGKKITGPAEESTSRRSEALLLYLGVGVTPYPKRDAQRLVDRFGPVESSELVAYCEGVLTEMYDVRPDWTTDDLLAATERVVAVVASGHPELSADALAGLGWSYSWDWK
jgi:hypothetical protein